jgi:hypothetical protein
MTSKNFVIEQILMTPSYSNYCLSSKDTVFRLVFRDPPYVLMPSFFFPKYLYAYVNSYIKKSINDDNEKEGDSKYQPKVYSIPGSC